MIRNILTGGLLALIKSQEIHEENTVTGISFNGQVANDGMGSSVEHAGDINGDGIDDLIMGLPYSEHHGQLERGTAYVFFGNKHLHFSGKHTLDLLTMINHKKGVRIHGQSAGDHFGNAAAHAGDINGDGVSDLVIGAWGAGVQGKPHTGAAYVLFGNPKPKAWKKDISDWNHLILNRKGIKMHGQAEGDQMGISVASAGDINADGISDLIIGAHQAGPTRAGAAYILFGSTNPNAWQEGVLDWDALIAHQKGCIIHGQAPGDYFGSSVASAGDINGDGIDDLVIGAWGADPHEKPYAGAIYVLFGSQDPTAWASGTLEWHDLIQHQRGFIIHGQNAGDRMGICVAHAGDMNGDGISDLAMGARGAGPDDIWDSGALYVLFGSRNPHYWGSGILEWDDLIKQNKGFKIYGQQPGDYFGTTIAQADDINGDGIDDLMIGSWGYGSKEKPRVGCVTVLLGSQDPKNWREEDLQWSTLFANKQALMFHGLMANDHLGSSIARATDINGNGIPDLIMGADRYDTGAPGKIYALVDGQYEWTPVYAPEPKNTQFPNIALILIKVSGVLVCSAYTRYRLLIIDQRHTHPFVYHVRAQCRLPFAEPGALKDCGALNTTLHMLIAELDNRYNNFFKKLKPHEKKLFAVCLSGVLQDLNLLTPLTWCSGLSVCLCTVHWDWPYALDLDACKRELPKIARTAVRTWRRQDLDQRFEWAKDIEKHHLCCAKTRPPASTEKDTSALDPTPSVVADSSRPSRP